MRRREFIALLGAAALTSPFLARAQTSDAVRQIGSLTFGEPGHFDHVNASFERGLGEAGFDLGRNVIIERTYAYHQVSQLPALAASLVQRRVDLIVATGGSRPALAAKAATATIPIVFVTGGDPVQSGLVKSMNKPGANVTGITFLSNPLSQKRISILRGLLPRASRLGVLMHPSAFNGDQQIEQVRSAATQLGFKVELARTATDEELEHAVRSFSTAKIDVALVIPDVFFSERVSPLARLGLDLSLPIMSNLREFAHAGGLISYGNEIVSAFRQAGVVAGRILRGTHPSEIPVEQTSRFELVINLQTARALKIDVPPTLAALADEVIE